MQCPLTPMIQAFPKQRAWGCLFDATSEALTSTSSFIAFQSKPGLEASVAAGREVDILGVALINDSVRSLLETSAVRSAQTHVINPEEEQLGEESCHGSGAVQGVRFCHRDLLLLLPCSLWGQRPEPR